MRRPSPRRRLEAVWYGPATLASTCLAPLAGVYGAAMALRRAAYRHGAFAVTRLPVPVVVVGNLVAGGTGKTPVVGWFAARARALGFRPGIVARGYGGRVGRGPHRVRDDDPAALVGDEPLLQLRETGAPVVVGADRPAAAALLVAAGCDLVLADDGLQHLALGRDREVLVVDGERLAGNGRLLPAGPLREPWNRLGFADLVLVHGPVRDPARLPPAVTWQSFELVADTVRAFGGTATRSLDAFAGQSVRALAGIGNPERFYRQLRAAGLQVTPVPVDDHGRARPDDLAGAGPLLMTAKDAVKYRPADKPAAAEWWVVSARLEAGGAAQQAVDQLLTGLRGTDAPPGPTSMKRT